MKSRKIVFIVLALAVIAIIRLIVVVAMDMTSGWLRRRLIGSRA